jgi:hypothetical protein
VVEQAREKQPMAEYVHFDFEEIVRETDKALLIRFSDGDEHWIPLSQVCDPDDYHAGDKEGTISLTEWIVKQKEL